MSRLTLDIRVGFVDSVPRIIITPSNVLLPFVPKKQRALHYLSFRQTVAQQEESLTPKHQPAGWCFSFYLSNIKFLSFHIFQVGFYFLAYLAVFGGEGL